MKAHAKLNLYLEVTGKRPNGYHELQSQVVFLDLHDELEVKESAHIKIHGAAIENNIIIKAANILKEKFKVAAGAEFKLQKNIPIGAGLGGGSADAAVALVLLNQFWKLNISDSELYKIGLSLGADVPVCLYSILENKNTAHFSGIGDIVSPAPATQNHYFLLVNPGKPLATKDVFANYIPQNLKPKTNHLESAAIKLMPEIKTILDVIGNQKNCLTTRMTGSGATCFGIFKSLEDAKRGKENISKINSSWLTLLTQPKA